MNVRALRFSCAHVVFRRSGVYKHYTTKKRRKKEKNKTEKKNYCYYLVNAYYSSSQVNDDYALRCCCLRCFQHLIATIGFARWSVCGDETSCATGFAGTFYEFSRIGRVEIFCNENCYSLFWIENICSFINQITIRCRSSMITVFFRRFCGFFFSF